MKARNAMAATEFVLILPPLVTLLLGCIDFGRFATTQFAVTAAAQAAAQTGSTTPRTPATLSTWEAAVLARASDELAGRWSMTDQNGRGHQHAHRRGRALQVARYAYPFHVTHPLARHPEVMLIRETVAIPTIRPTDGVQT